MPPVDRLNLRARWLASPPTGQSDYDGESLIYDLEYATRTEDLEFWRDQVDGVIGLIADLGCGTGRITRYLRGHGGSVVGVDSSVDMIRRGAPGNTSERGWLGGSLCALPLRSESVDAIIAPFGAFNYLLSPTEQIAAATELVRVAKLGALVVVEIAMVPLGSRYAERQTPLRLEQSLTGTDTRVDIFSQAELDVAWNVCRYVRIVEKSGGRGADRLILHHDWHIYTVFEAVYLFMLVGLTVLDVLGDYDYRPYSGASKKLIIRMKK